MSIARGKHHAEWLSLIEVAGPFLTLPVLERVFPQGLDKDDSPEAKAHARNLRLALDEWEDNQTGKRPNPAIHKAWIDFVLKQTLGFSKDAARGVRRVRLCRGRSRPADGCAQRASPQRARPQPAGRPQCGKARLLVQAYTVEQDLERPVVGRPLSSSPRPAWLNCCTPPMPPRPRHQRRTLDAGQCSHGARRPASPRGTPTSGSKNRSPCGPSAACLGQAVLRRADDETLEEMLAESAEQPAGSHRPAGYQVRKAVEVLIQSLDRADQDHGRQLLGRRARSRTLRGRPHGHDAAGVPLLRRENGNCCSGRSDSTIQHYAVSTLRGTAAGGRRPARRGSARTPPRRLVSAAGHLPGRLRRRLA